MSLVLICPTPDEPACGARLEGILSYALGWRTFRAVRTAEELVGLQGKRLLFALSLGDTGTNLEYVRMLARLRRETGLLEGCTAGVIVDGATALYTKSAAAELTLTANLAGCAFVGRPLVEGTRTLQNFNIIAANLQTDNRTAFRRSVRELVERLVTFDPPAVKKPTNCKALNWVRTSTWQNRSV